MSYLGQFEELQEVQLFRKKEQQCLAFLPSSGRPPNPVDVLLGTTGGKRGRGGRGGKGWGGGGGGEERKGECNLQQLRKAAYLTLVIAIPRG